MLLSEYLKIVADIEIDEEIDAELEIADLELLETENYNNGNEEG